MTALQAATRAFIACFADALGAELPASGVRVTALVPGCCSTRELLLGEQSRLTGPGLDRLGVDPAAAAPVGLSRPGGVEPPRWG